MFYKALHIIRKHIYSHSTTEAYMQRNGIAIVPSSKADKKLGSLCELNSFLLFLSLSHFPVKLNRFARLSGHHIVGLFNTVKSEKIKTKLQLQKGKREIFIIKLYNVQKYLGSFLSALFSFRFVLVGHLEMVLDIFKRVTQEFMTGDLYSYHRVLAPKQKYCLRQNSKWWSGNNIS